MNDFSQIVPVSSLPRKYNELIRRANYTNKPIILFRRNRPVASLIDYDLLQKFLEAKRQQELEDALKTIAAGEKAYRAGKTKVLKKPADLWKK